MRRKIAIAVFSALFLACLLWPAGEGMLVHIDQTMLPPSAEHWLGTDNLGRDILVLLTQGCSRTLLVVGLSTMISLVLGTGMGLLSGYMGRLWTAVIQFIADFTLVVPSFILALIVSALFGLTPITAALVFGIGNLGEYCNQAAALTERVRRRTFVESEVALGIPKLKILIRHIVPNIRRPLLTFMSGKASGIAVQYAALTYIGLGCDISNPDWGTMLYQYRGYVLTKPLLVVLPAGAIFIIALFFHIVFDDMEGNDKDVTIYD